MRRRGWLLKCICTLVAITIFGFWQSTRYEQMRIVQTDRQLFRLSSTLTRAIVAGNTIQGQSIQELIRFIKSVPDLGLEANSPALLNDGKDAWGNAIIVEYDDGSYRLRLRSMGANRKDDNGTGDDMEYVVDLTPLERKSAAVPDTIPGSRPRAAPTTGTP